MKITKTDYEEALEKVLEYEKQLTISDKGVECYIMHRTSDHSVFVTTNEEFAKRCYDTNDYIMRVSMLYE